MSMKDAFEEVARSTAREADILRNEIAIFKNLVKERKHPLDLVRELLSNAGAREVGATRIEISYTKDREGHIFEIRDNGCGMSYTGHQTPPGRLDRFLGLGMSAIGGLDSDEFSWKGLGSKLAYHSRRVEVETRYENHPEHTVVVNEPWSSLDRNLMPKFRISDYPDSDRETGTRIRVVGHPPHRQESPFTMTEIRSYLLHRTFAGFTRERENPPEITLSVLGNQEVLPFGFPEFRGIEWPKGVVFDEEQNRLIVKIIKDWPKLGLVILKGFLAWDAGRYGLEKDGLNTGLILSARGIPYSELDMEEYGARSILRGFPGKGNTCLVIECDRMSAEMNISRSDLVDSAETLEFKKAVRALLEQLETSTEYLEKFRSIPQKKKRKESADHLEEQKRAIESEEQNWVVLQREGKEPVLLMREPQNENEVNALIWKLEALDALPFQKFQSLGYVGAQKGPDLLANFQEDRDSEPLRAAVVEIENNFYSYKAHGHKPSQYPKVICWDAPTSGRKDRLNTVRNKKYKFTINVKNEEYQVHVFVLKLMDGIRVVPRRELADLGIVL
jgi:hypothetical protein